MFFPYLLIALLNGLDMNTVSFSILCAWLKELGTCPHLVPQAQPFLMLMDPCKDQNRKTKF